MNTLQEITEIFEARKEKEIKSKIEQFLFYTEEIKRLKQIISELEEKKYFLFVEK